MTLTDRAIEVGTAAQDVINCLYLIREMRADSPFVTAVELEEWGEIFARAQRIFAEMAVDIQEGRMETSLRLSSNLTRSFADFRAYLSVIAPGAQLPATLFDLVDIVWSELMNAFDH